MDHRLAMLSVALPSLLLHAFAPLMRRQSSRKKALRGSQLHYRSLGSLSNVPCGVRLSYRLGNQFLVLRAKTSQTERHRLLCEQ